MNTRCLLIVVTALAFAAQAYASPLFDRGATWRWRPGTNEASAPVSAWRLAGFNDAQFTPAPAPFWYGDPLPGGTQITGMQNNYLCIFLRLPVVITNLGEIAGLRLGALVDDGFVAWINGTEVLRVNMPGPPGSEVTITNLADNATEPVSFVTYALPDPAGYLVSGTNLVAVQVFQSSLGSSDLGFDASLEAILVETNPPTIVSVNPERDSIVTSLTEMVVSFSEPVTGVDASDLRLNGAPAFQMTALSSSNYLFSFPQPAYGTVQVTWDALSGIADQALPPNPFDPSGPGTTWQYTLIDTTPPVMSSVTPTPGTTVPSLTEITVQFSEGVTGVDAADLRINNVPASGLAPAAADRYTFTFPEPAAGAVQVAWAAGHGITDLAPAANAFAGGNWVYTFDPAATISPPYISEFMALNTRTLRDSDGDYSDWIEIHNPSGVPVDLQNWCLTDNTNDLTKWRFPTTNLAGGQFLVVFASEKNRRIPGGQLHTNFRLSGGGEYLALVKPDGVTIVSEFRPAFPPQAADVSYGFGLLTTNLTVVPPNAPVRVRVPANGAEGLAWTLREYNDSAWTLGTNGVGFGSTNATAADYSATVLPTQPVGYWRFSETSGTTAANAGSGGAGLNGTYSGVTLGAAGPRPPQQNGFEANNTAPTFNGSSAYVGVSSSLLSGRNAFTIGGWVRPAAAQAARTGLFGQNDCVEFGFIDAGTLQCWTPSGGSVNATYSPTVGNWFHVVAVGNGSNIRIFINGALAATGGAATSSYGTSAYNFNIGGNGIFDASGNWFNGQLDEVVAYHRALSDTEISALYQGGLTPVVVPVTPFIRTDIAAAMSNVNASAYLRLPFNVADPARVAQLTLRMRYDDGFVAFLNGIEVLRANAPETLAFNAAATNSHSPGSVEEFRLGGVVLQTNLNVLAIQGLNRAANDEDFLIVAELVATFVAASSSNALFFAPATPGAENVGGVVYPGPSIVNPTHTPNVPLDPQDLVVTAQVLPTFNAISNLVLRYRIMFNPEIETPMFDDGLHGDGASGDGVYGATIPASASTNGQMIRWFFRAQDVLGYTSRWPLFDAAANSDSSEYLGTIVDPTNVVSKLPIIHLFAPANILGPGPTTTQTGADSQAGARVSLFYDGEFYDNVHMQLRGNTTAGYNKKSHRLEFNRDHLFRHAGAGFGKPDRPAPRIGKTSFVADYPDPTYMRQGLAFWLCDLIGSPGSFYYPVRLQLNGQFYQLANHNDVQADDLLARLGWDPNGALYNAAGVVRPSRDSTGGFEKKTRRWDNDNDYTALAGGINETNALATRTVNFFENFDVPNVLNYLVAARWCHENDDVWANMSLYHDNDGDNLWRIIGFDMNLSWGAIFYEGGTPSVIEGVQATNDIHKAHPLYGSSQTPALSGPGAPNNYNRVYDTVFQVPQLREMYLRRLRTLMDTCVTPPGTAPSELVMEKKMLEWRDLIAEEAERDRNFWNWPAKGGQCNFDPGIRLTNGVDAMISEFVVKRRLHFYGKHCVTNTDLPIGITKDRNAGIPLSQPLNTFVTVHSIEVNPASSNQAQEFICLTNPMPFALDLSGWKLEGAVQFTFPPGTVMASNTLLYVSPDVRAFRARTTGPRGGQGLFVVGPYQGQLSARGETIVVKDNLGRLVTTNTYAGNPSLAQQYLRVTELMYNPAPPIAGTNTEADFEFIELKNISTNVTLNLNGVRFINGIVFDFTGGAVTTLAPGATVLVVRNTTAFAARYGGGQPVAGQYGPYVLDNGGERLRLVDATGEEILDFTYNDNWYPITDGLGFSLVVVDEQAEPDEWSRKRQWRPSGQSGGSPGANDPAPPVFVPVVINEALTRTDNPPPTDSIELYNPTATPAPIGGWYLTDDFDTPKKYRIPLGTVLPAGAYLKFDESQFNPTPGVPPSFALGADGEEVFLFSADAGGQLTGYVHGYDFGAAENGVSFGRHVTSDGREHFVAQTALSLGTNNPGPKVGPVVINEIMYRPPDVAGMDNADDEFVELLNITGSTVSLFDNLLPGNTWRLTGGVGFNFPTNVQLAAGGYLLLVNFNPTNVTLLAAFRAKYGVGANVPIFGPYSGKLNNAGEDVELKKPTTPILGVTPYVLVDKVSYRDEAPWPAGADGYGLSLQRRDAAAFGNEPTNWVAALPTAAAPNVSGGTPPAIVAHPTNQMAVAYTTVTMSVSATGDAPLRYQWRYNGALLPGATNATLELLNVQPGAIGDYEVLVFNSFGSVVSSNATLSLLIPVSFVLHPAGATVFPQTNVTLSALAFSTTPITYQWRFNGTNLPGATNNTYTLTNAQPAQSGDYSLLATDAIGSALSQPARLTVLDRPLFTREPTNTTARLGATPVNVTFSAAAISTTPVRYQWLYNGAPVTWTNAGGITSSNLVLTNVQAWQAGPYAVVASDDYGSATSSNATLGVLFTPVVTDQPQSQVLAAGSDLVMNVAVSNASTLPVSYRWRRGGSTVTNLVLDNITCTLMIPAAGTNQAGVWSVVVTNIAGIGGLSSNAFITMVVPPTNAVADQGANATLSVLAVGVTRPLYQWHFGVNPLASETNAALTLTGLQTNQEGAYSVAVFSTTNSGTNLILLASNTFPAQLLVLGDRDGDGMPDRWELTYGLNWTNAADAALDADGDTMSNLHEFIAGTDPTNALSYLKVDTLAVTNAATLSFVAVSNRTYRVQFNNDLPLGAWSQLVEVAPAPTNRVATVTDTNLVPRRVYRLVIPPAGP